MRELGWLLLGAASLLAVAGVVLLAAGRLPFLGRLPGDIRIEGERGAFFFPITTCLLISVVATLVLNLLARWFRKGP